MPNAPQYVSVAPPRVKFSPGNGLPDISNTGVLVTVQATLDALTAAATLSGISLSYSAAAPTNYVSPSGSGAPLSATATSLQAANQSVGGSFNQRALRRFHAALGDRNANPCDIFVAAGDSLMASYMGSTFAKRFDQRFLAAMRARFPQTPVGGAGLLSAQVAGGGLVNPYPDAPQGAVASAVFYPPVGSPGWGLDSSTASLAAATKARSWTFTGTGFDFSWLSSTGGTGGTFTVTVDGTTYGVYNAGTGALTAGAGTIATTQVAPPTPFGYAYARIRGLAAASHTVTATWASGGTVYINNGFAYNGDETSGIRCALNAWPGIGTRGFVGAAGGLVGVLQNPYPGDGVTLGNPSEQWLTQIARGYYLPDLVLLDNFANDYASSTGFQVTPSENQSNLASIIAKIKAAVVTGTAAQSVASYVPSFVIMPPQAIAQGLPPGYDSWQAYVSNAYTIAANDPDNAVCVLDTGQRLQGTSNTFDNSIYQGLLSSDKTHYSDAGNDWLANVLVDFLKP